MLFVIVLLYVNLVFSKDYTFTEKALEAPKSPGQVCLALTQKAPEIFVGSTAFSCIQTFTGASHQGPKFASSFTSSHVEIQGSLALSTLQQTE